MVSGVWQGPFFCGTLDLLISLTSRSIPRSQLSYLKGSVRKPPTLDLNLDLTGFTSAGRVFFLLACFLLRVDSARQIVGYEFVYWPNRASFSCVQVLK